MKATVDLYIKPFQTPNFVTTKNEDGSEGPSVPLSSIDPIALEQLCDDFKKQVFKKAGKIPPPKLACCC